LLGYQDLPVVSDENFNELVSENESRFLLLDFAADWCEPCKAMEPIVAEIAGEMVSSMQVGRVDLDKSPGLAERFRVFSIPCLVLLDGSTVKLRVRGPQSLRQLRRALSAEIDS
jgi:thioredoxin-like negative regulator of GroEL